VTVEELFAHYFPPIGDPSATFASARLVFDTNVFLDLYRLGPVARSEVLAGLRQGVSSRLWIPHHVLLEVSKNRTALVLEAADRHAENVVAIEAARVQARGALENAAVAQSIEPKILSEALKAVDGAFEKISGDVKLREENSKTDLAGDEVLRFINEVLLHQEAKAPTQDWYDTAAKEAADRSSKRLPPGYKDERKDEIIRAPNAVLIAQKHGDFYIWKQLIDEVRARPDDFANVIFVTSDRKEDWWELSRGKAQGPRPELRLEIQEAGAQTFHMYQLTRLLEFLRVAQQKSDGIGPISEKTVADVREVEQQADSANLVPDGLPTGAWLAALHRVTGEGYQGFYTQRAVESWLREVFPEHTVVENASFPDLVVRIDESTSHGFEVVTPRNPEQLRALIYGKLGLARNWLDGIGSLLAGPGQRMLTFVVTLTPRALNGAMGEALWIRVATTIAEELSSTEGLQFLIGRIEEGTFRPLPALR
jgi:PIN like domain